MREREALNHQRFWEKTSWIGDQKKSTASNSQATSKSAFRLFCTYFFAIWYLSQCTFYTLGNFSWSRKKSVKEIWKSWLRIFSLIMNYSAKKTWAKYFRHTKRNALFCVQFVLHKPDGKLVSLNGLMIPPEAVVLRMLSNSSASKKI